MNNEGDLMLLDRMLCDGADPRGHEHGDDMEDADYDVFGHGGELDQRQEPSETMLSGARPAEETGEGQTKWVPMQAGSSTDGMQMKVGAPNGWTASGSGGEKQRDVSNSRNSLIVHEAARAKSTQGCVVGAREGPEGPRDACATVAAAPSLGRDAAATVTAKREAAILRLDDYARGARAERGEAAGPPSGCAAPLEGCKRDTADDRPCISSPQKWPQRPVAGAGRPGRNSPQKWPQGPVAGAGNSWHALSEEDGKEPARGVVRRRVGADDPPAQDAVARSGGDATALSMREEPCEGSNSCVPNARNECKTKKGGEEEVAVQDGCERLSLRRGLPSERRRELDLPGARPSRRRHGDQRGVG